MQAIWNNLCDEILCDFRFWLGLPLPPAIRLGQISLQLRKPDPKILKSYGSRQLCLHVRLQVSSAPEGER